MKHWILSLLVLSAMFCANQPAVASPTSRAPQGKAYSSCIYGKKRHRHGATFSAKDRCNRCTCYRGKVYCTQHNCKMCRYQGIKYKNGQTFRAKDGCNRCLCRRGQLYCTQRRCIKNCRYNGQFYRHGQVFRMRGQRCTCIQGQVSCAPDRPSTLPKLRIRPILPNKCAGFYYKICKKDSDCKDGYYCTNFSSECRSSLCFCDFKTGKIGGCTMDCMRDFGLCTKK